MPFCVDADFVADAINSEEEAPRLVRIAAWVRELEGHVSTPGFGTSENYQTQ